MKSQRYILIADDDQGTLDVWERDIKDFNGEKDSKVTFVPVFAKDRDAAISCLDRTRINCASVDLRMPLGAGKPATAQAQDAGNDVLERLLIDFGVPAVVYSGYPQEVSERVRQSPIKVQMKERDGAMKALRWLADHESLMSAMEASGRKIAAESARLFSNSIWPRWSTTWRTDDKHLTNVITRQLASHLAETLGVPETDFHPEEFYQVPSLNDDSLATGDLVCIGENIYLVVTPRCNMARDSYPMNIMLALCGSVGEPWQVIATKFKSGDTKKIESAAKALKSYATQAHATATHFLPPCGGKGPWLADFKEIMTVPSTEVPTLLTTRFASIAPSFVPNLVQRYAAYLGRIGQPDLDCEVLRIQLST